MHDIVKEAVRILLVEDDAMIGEVLCLALKDAAYAVDWLRSGREALDALECQHYDLMLLDLALPGMDGLTVLHAIRNKKCTMPTLIISARDDLDDRIGGLDRGADDYLTKPFEMSELLARMRAVLRRTGNTATPLLSNGIISLDPATMEARLLDGDQGAVQLSNREFALLRALMVRPGAILSRNMLEEKIYGWGEEVESNAIEFLIHSLRRKLGKGVIKNVRGAGWMVARG